MDKQYFDEEIFKLDECYKIVFYTLKQELYVNFEEAFDNYVVNNIVEVYCTELGCINWPKEKLDDEKRQMAKDFKIDYEKIKYNIDNNKMSEFCLQWLIKEQNVFQFWSSNFMRARFGSSNGGIDVVSYDNNKNILIIGEAKATTTNTNYETVVSKLNDQFIGRITKKDGHDTFVRLKQMFSHVHTEKIYLHTDVLTIEKKIFVHINNIIDRLSNSYDISDLVKCTGIITIVCHINYDKQKNEIIAVIKKNLENKNNKILSKIRKSSKNIKLKIYIFPKWKKGGLNANG